MTDDELSSIIERLDRELPRAGALVKLHQYGGGPDESQVIANRAGYLRLGIELLKGALAPSTDPDHRGIHVDIDYLVTGDSTLNFDWFERREDLEGRSTSTPTPGRVAAVVGITIFVSVLVLSLIGLVTVLRALF